MTCLTTRFEGRPVRTGTLAAMVTRVLLVPATAAVLPADPARFWDYNVVYYRFQPLLERMGVCTPQGAPATYCDLNDEWAAAWSGKEDQIGQRTHFSKLDALTMSFLYPESDWRFIDWTSPFDEEAGSFLRPSKTFLDGVDAVPPGGTLFVQPGSYDGAGDLTKPMTFRAPIGPVHLGD